MEWMARKVVGSRQSGDGRKTRASWAAVLFALASLIVDVTSWVKADLQPLIEATRQNSETLQRIERRLEDHERRIAELERRKQ